MIARRYRGVAQIVLFNWPYYALAAFVAGSSAAALSFLPMPSKLRLVIAGGLAAIIFWQIGSLAASHYVYDRSRFNRWDWLPSLLPQPPARWVNIHCGHDETSRHLRRLFPESTGLLLDIYDAEQMTESSIRRARRFATDAPRAVPCKFSALPVGDGQLDAAFVIFAAHEIRQRDSRRRFFAELYRLLAPQGRIVLVEHLRDAVNFAAFGPGFWHFLPPREWLRLAQKTGFAVETEFRVTPFVRVFVLGKDSQR
jgi:SAM-dependent methyltransferase